MDLFHVPEVCFHAQRLMGQGPKQEHRPDVPFHRKTRSSDVTLSTTHLYFTSGDQG